MSFKLPTFNISIEVCTYSIGSPPFSPRFTVMAAWTIRRYAIAGSGISGGPGFLARSLLVPSGTDIRPLCATYNGDLIQFHGNLNVYRVFDADYVSRGYPTQHIAAVIGRNNVGLVFPIT